MSHRIMTIFLMTVVGINLSYGKSKTVTKTSESTSIFEDDGSSSKKTTKKTQLKESQIRIKSEKPASLTMFHLTPVLGANMLTLRGKTNLTVQAVKKDALIETLDASSKAGAVGGIHTEFIANRWAFETGLVYFQTWMNSERQVEDAKIETTTNIDYLSVPLIGKFCMFGSPQHGLFLKGGITPALVISARQEVSSNDPNVPSGMESIKADVGSHDFIGSLGLNGKIRLSHRLILNFDAEYQKGFMNLDKHDGQLYNQGYMVTSGLSILFE